MRFLTIFADSLSNQKICDELSGDLAEAAGCSTSATTPDSLVSTITSILLLGVGLFSVVMIIFGAVQIASSAGNTSSVEKGKKTILYAVLGLILSLLSYVILNFVLDLI